jgi:hypothetical protein
MKHISELPCKDFPFTNFPSEDLKFYISAILYWIFLTIASLFLIFLAGCSHAGPYVTRITPTFDGLEIEKCYVDFYYLSGNIATGKCHVDQLKTRD